MDQDHGYRLSPLKDLRETHVHFHKKVRARRFHGKNFSCVCSGKNLDINEFWWEVQDGRQASHVHPMVSSGNHTMGTRHLRSVDQDITAT